MINFDESVKDNEKQAAKKMEQLHWMISYYPGREKPWGVFLGSHGNDGRTLRQAIKKCLACCKIGHWWKMDSGKIAQDEAAEIIKEFNL